MRLAAVTDAPELWGAENSLVDLMSRAGANGFDATILAPSTSPIHSHPRLASRTAALDMPVHPALARGGIRHASARDLISEVGVLQRGARAIAEATRDFDVVLSFRLWRNQEVLMAARHRGLPAVVDLHETFDGRVGKLLSSVTLRQARAIVAPSRSVAESACAPRSRLHVVPRAMAFDSVKPAIREGDRLVVGIFGQLRRHKGHALAMAAALLANQSVPLELRIFGSEGDPGVSDDIEAASSAHPVMIKAMPFTDTPVQAMSECHIILNCSSHEAFGRTVVEGLSVGCLPVVTGGGPAEIVNDVGIGLIAAPTPTALAEAFVRAWKRPTLLQSALRDGPRIVRERYSLDSVAREYFSVIRNATL
jgi:glycosyltransferase involved in cell wall biosynthesis